MQSIASDEVLTFVLSRSEMKEEVRKCGASSAHGTKEANKDNKNKELRFSVKRDTEHWKRWNERYLRKDSALFREI